MSHPLNKPREQKRTAYHYIGFLKFGWVWRGLRRHVLTRENAIAVLVSLMLLLIYLFGTMGSQARFVYGGF